MTKMCNILVLRMLSGRSLQKKRAERWPSSRLPKKTSMSETMTKTGTETFHPKRGPKLAEEKKKRMSARALPCTTATLRCLHTVERKKNRLHHRQRGEHQTQNRGKCEESRARRTRLSYRSITPSELRLPGAKSRMRTRETTRNSVCNWVWSPQKMGGHERRRRQWPEPHPTMSTWHSARTGGASDNIHHL